MLGEFEDQIFNKAIWYFSRNPARRLRWHSTRWLLQAMPLGAV